MKQTTQYKNTAIGKIPMDWEVRKLGEECIITMGQSPSSEFYNDECVGLPLIQGNADIVDGKSIIRFYTSQITKTCEKNELIFTVRAPVGEIGIASYTSCLGRGVCSIKHSNLNTLNYVKFYLENYRANWSKLSQGSTFEAISGNELKQFQIPLPPLSEQQKIAKVLSSWDKAIQETNVIIKKLKRRNKALANQLFLNDDNRSNQKQIMQIVDRIKNSFTPEENALYKQIGIRSHAKGLFYKEAVTGRILGNKSVFWIEPNCFIVNIVFAWEQAIGKTTDADIGFIASHRFPMYKPKAGILNLDYLLYFFKSLKGKYLLELASPGGAGRNKTLGQTDFLKLKIPVPSIEEQIRLVDILDTATKEIQQYQQKLSNLKLQKKGLMQQLLTGKTRIV